MNLEIFFASSLISMLGPADLSAFFVFFPTYENNHDGFHELMHLFELTVKTA